VIYKTEIDYLKFNLKILNQIDTSSKIQHKGRIKVPGIPKRDKIKMLQGKIITTEIKLLEVIIRFLTITKIKIIVPQININYKIKINIPVKTIVDIRTMDKEIDMVIKVKINKI